jgi:hypothetical protein
MVICTHFYACFYEGVSLSLDILHTKHFAAETERLVMPETSGASAVADDKARPRDVAAQMPFKTEPLENAILRSAHFAIIATGERHHSVVQRRRRTDARLRRRRCDHKKSPSDLHNPQEVSVRAEGLSAELALDRCPAVANPPRAGDDLGGAMSRADQRFIRRG